MTAIRELLELGWVGEQFDMQIKQGAHYGPYRFEFTDDETGEPFKPDRFLSGRSSSG